MYARKPMPGPPASSKKLSHRLEVFSRWSLLSKLYGLSQTTNRFHSTIAPDRINHVPPPAAETAKLTGAAAPIEADSVSRNLQDCSPNSAAATFDELALTRQSRRQCRAQVQPCGGSKPCRFSRMFQSRLECTGVSPESEILSRVANQHQRCRRVGVQPSGCRGRAKAWTPTAH